MPNPVQKHHFPDGMSVRQLKALIKDWPDLNEYTGEENEVWLHNNGFSNQVKTVMPLNFREHEGRISADIIFGKD